MEHVKNLLLSFPAPARLLTDEQAAERDRRARIESGKETRLENLRKSGVSKHLGPGDASRIVRGQVSDTPAMQLVQRWADPQKESARRWMIISGTVGIGKTVAAGWLLGRDGGRYVTMTDLVRMFSPILRGLAPQTHDDALARLDALAGCRTLVLDELGRDGLSPEVAREALHWLVEARHGAKTGRTLVLSNLSAVELRRRFHDGTYDSRTESRLRPLLARQTDGTGIFEIKGRDMRGAAI